MRATDFIYDGIQLSELGYMIGYLDGGSSLGAVDTDSQRSFSNLTLFGGKWQPATVATYKDTLRFNFSVIKNPCNGDDNAEISLEDIRVFKRWLNRPDFHELRIIDDEFDGIFWKGSANVKEVHNSGVCVGFDVTFFTDRPFGLADEIGLTGNAEANEKIVFVDISDEIGRIYPDFTVTVLSAGNLTITNNHDALPTVVKNCSANETITFSKILQVTSDKGTHNLSNDFNWHFPRIVNDFNDIENVFTFSLPVNYSIKYNPIVKAVIA